MPSALPELRKKTLTGTSDVGVGTVVVVVGRCGLRRWKGTRDDDMVLGLLCVGMAQPAATIATTPSSSAAARRLTRSLRVTLLTRSHSSSPGSSPWSSTGSVRMKRAPPLSEDSTLTLPCITRMCSSTSARPSPVPVPVPRRPEAEPR